MDDVVGPAVYRRWTSKEMWREQQTGRGKIFSRLM